jgi:hypothetical protein
VTLGFRKGALFRACWRGRWRLKGFNCTRTLKGSWDRGEERRGTYGGSGGGSR